VSAKGLLVSRDSVIKSDSIYSETVFGHVLYIEHICISYAARYKTANFACLGVDPVVRSDSISQLRVVDGRSSVDEHMTDRHSAKGLIGEYVVWIGRGADFGCNTIKLIRPYLSSMGQSESTVHIDDPLVAGTDERN